MDFSRQGCYQGGSQIEEYEVGTLFGEDVGDVREGVPGRVVVVEVFGDCGFERKGG